MPPAVGSLFFEVYKNGKLVELPSEVIPRAFDDWLNEFESPILDHVFENGVFSSTRDTGMSVSFIDRIEYIKASSENPALPADINVGTYKVKFTKFSTSEDQEVEQNESEAARMLADVARLNAERARLRAQNIARANAAAGPIGAGAGPAPAQPAAPARRRPVNEDPENVEDEDSKRGGRRTKKSKRRAKKRRYTRRR